MTRLIALLFIVPLTAVAPAAYADDHDHDNDRELKLEDLPKAARDAVQREVKDGKITDIDRDHDHAQMYYEVEFIQDNRRQEIHVAQDGTVLLRKND